MVLILTVSMRGRVKSGKITQWWTHVFYFHFPRFSLQHLQLRDGKRYLREPLPTRIKHCDLMDHILDSVWGSYTHSIITTVGPPYLLRIHSRKPCEYWIQWIVKFGGGGDSLVHKRYYKLQAPPPWIYSNLLMPKLWIRRTTVKKNQNWLSGTDCFPLVLNEDILLESFHLWIIL